MTILTAFEIFQNYPNDILINLAQNDKTGKWTSFMYRTKDRNIHKLLLSFDGEEWDTKKQAEDYMHHIAKLAIDVVKKRQEPSS